MVKVCEIAHSVPKVAAVEAAESLRQSQADQQRAQAQCRHRLPITQIEAADADNQDVGQDEVHKAPGDVDRRRRQSLATRCANGDWKGRPEMPQTKWGGVDEK